VSDRKIQRGEALFERYGAVTVFWARFVFGMRVIAGPLAGVLRMNWRKFVLYNILGASLWVSVIAALGFVFGKNWARLVRILRSANELLLVAAVVVALYLWWRYRKCA
jgi:membrane-associated protein